MSFSIPHIAICVCTFQRQELLRRLLRELETLKTEDTFTYSIVVADNDQDESARSLAEEFAERSHIPLRYCAEPIRNLALVRNRALSHAQADFVAFIDDDEFPMRDWLLQLFRTCETERVAGVLGPVVPYFKEQPPRWLQRGRFYDRPRHRTGFRLSWEGCRTGNVLFRRKILDNLEIPFREIFRTGGEDQDFFRRAMKKGFSFCWCDEAVAFEEVTPARWRSSFMLKRALLRGRNSLRHPAGRAKNLAKSALAVPLYCLALPFVFLTGRHRFLNCLIRLCDHAGRLLAFCGLNPISEREM